LPHVIKKIGQSAFIHIGCASANTLPRNFGGQSPGVRGSRSLSSRLVPCWYTSSRPDQSCVRRSRINSAS
jgi:hypothetical protein